VVGGAAVVGFWRAIPPDDGTIALTDIAGSTGAQSELAGNSGEKIRPPTPIGTAFPTGGVTPPSTSTMDGRHRVPARWRPKPPVPSQRSVVPGRRTAAPTTPAGLTTSTAPHSITLTAQTPDSTVPTTSASGNSSFVDQVVTLTNQQRAAQGCSALAVNATLTSVAQAHSVDMSRRNFFDHVNPDGESPFDRMSAAGYRYRLAAENIAAGQRTPQEVVTGWMNSAGHRANILNCGLTQIGVGYATGGSYGIYWTQDFGTPLG
jgi:uncharacterized protein YkwD